MRAGAISRIPSCSPAAGLPLPSRNREIPLSSAVPPGKLRRRRQRRKLALALPRRRNFQSPVHPFARSPKNLCRVSPLPPLQSSPPCRLTGSAIFRRDARTVWEIPDPPDDSRPNPRFPIRGSCAQRFPRHQILCPHRQSLEFLPHWRQNRQVTRPRLELATRCPVIPRCNSPVQRRLYKPHQIRYAPPAARSTRLAHQASPRNPSRSTPAIGLLLSFRATMPLRLGARNPVAKPLR